MRGNIHASLIKSIDVVDKPVLTTDGEANKKGFLFAESGFFFLKRYLALCDTLVTC